MNRTIEDIQKDIELLGIKGGYDIEQLLTPQDCRRLSYEIERLNNIINEFDKWLLGEQMMFYRGSDDERLIRYGETRNKWLELKRSDKEEVN